jgi:hypothetical protein
VKWQPLWHRLAEFVLRPSRRFLGSRRSSRVKTYKLKSDGDPVERKYWDLFLRDQFPSYETVWAKSVVPVTGRPDHGGFKSDEALAKIGLGPEDMCNAQLHYTAFTHLVRAFVLKEDEGGWLINPDQFLEAIVRLAAATDVADELLQRATNSGRYAPWADGRAARRHWREAHNYPLQELRDYRNRLLHGYLVPYQAVRQMDRVEGGVAVPVEQPALRFPKIGRETHYLDWRTLAHLTPVLVLRDFSYAQTIINDAWAKTVAYIDQEWQANLV